MKKVVNAIPQVLPKKPKSFPKDIGHSSDLDQEEKWCATLAHKPDGSWNRVAEQMMIIFAISGHPVFRGTGASFFKKRRTSRFTDTLQRGTVDCRTTATHHDVRQSAQCLRSRCGLEPIAAHCPSKTENPVANGNGFSWRSQGYDQAD